MVLTRKNILQRSISLIMSFVLIVMLMITTTIQVQAADATISNVPATFNVMKPLTETTLETGTQVFLSYRTDNLKGDLATTVAAIVTVTNEQNTSIDYHHGNYTYTIYVDVTFTNSLETFDTCPKGALVSNDGTTWAYYCWQGGRQNMPILAYITDTANGTLTVTMDDTKLHFNKDSLNQTIDQTDIKTITYNYTYDGVEKSGNFTDFTIKPENTTIGANDSDITVTYDLASSEQVVTLPVDYAVYFDVNGGNEQIDTQQIQVMSKVVEPTSPTKDGYTFNYWAKSNEANADEWDFANDTVNSVMTLYAVYKQNQSINANDINVTYGDNATVTPTLGVANSNQDIQYAITSGNDVISIDNTGKITTKKVGNATIKLSVDENDNFTGAEKTINVTVDKRPITVTANNKTITYGDENATLDYVVSTTTPFIEGDTVQNSFTGNITRTDANNNNVGTYTIQKGTLDSANYNINFVNGTYTINKKDITLKAENKTKIYGEDDPELTFALDTNSQMAFGETIASISGKPVREQGENTGEYVISKGTVNNNNYNIRFINGVFTITSKAIKIVAEDKTKIYGDEDPELTYKLAEDSEMAYNESINNLTGSLTREEGNNVGTYKIKQGTLSSDNYDIEFVSADFNITKKDITIIADNQTKVYGDDDPTLTYTLSEDTPMAYDETIADLEGSLTREEGNDVGTYSINQGTVNSDNYNITFKGADFVITKRPIHIFALEYYKYYGDEDPEELNFDLDEKTPLAYNDTMKDAFTGKLGREEGEEVKIYDITKGTLASKNYDFTLTTDNFSIIRRPIKITINDASKIYGDEDPEFTYTIDKKTPLVNNDTAKDAFVGTFIRTEGEDVGEYTISKGDFDSNNYEIEFTNGTLTINKRPITISADNQTKVYGGDEPELTYTISEKTPLVNKDTIDNSITGSLIRTLGKNVGSYDILQGSLDSKNYEIDFVNGLFTITKKPITIYAENKTKEYGKTDPELTYKTDEHLIFGDSLGKDIIITLERVAGEDSGTYAIKANKIESTNYDVTFKEGTLTIGAKPVVVLEVPKTGDNQNPTMAIILMILSVATICVLMKNKISKKQ